MNPQVADMDQDGDLDLIIGTRAGHTEYFERLDDGTLAKADTLFDIPAGANSNPLVTDWNNDGYPDLLISGIHTYHDHPRPVYLFINDKSDKYSVEPNNYDSVEAPLLDSIEKYRTVAWADVDGDKKGDLIVAVTTFDQTIKNNYYKVRWYKNEGTKEKPRFTNYTYFTFGGTEAIGLDGSTTFRLPYLTAADYNGDNVPDLLMGASQQKLGEPEELVVVWYGKRIGVGIHSTVSFAQKPTIVQSGKNVSLNALTGKWEYRVTNSRGQLLQSGAVTQSSSIQLSSLARGVYTLSVVQDGLRFQYQIRL